MRIVLAIALSLACATAHATTLEVKVEGLSCALCSAHLKEALKKAASASVIEPRLECGSIFLETNETPARTEAALSWPLMSNGFNLKSVEASGKTMEQARAMKC